MRCADISAENVTDGNWVTAKATFNDAITGTITMVIQLNMTHLDIFKYHIILFLLMALANATSLRSSGVVARQLI